MENVPKIVRERLKATAAGVNHPDPNLLTAFAERSLLAGERGAVMAHLEHCQDCRNIVALSLPEVERGEAAVAPSDSRWPAWPALRWGFALAGVLVIAALGVLRYQRHSEMAAQSRPAVTTEAKSTPPVAPTPEESRQGKVETAKVPAPANSSAGTASKQPAASASDIGISNGVAARSQGRRMANLPEPGENALSAVNVHAAVPPPPLAKELPNSQLVANAPVPAMPPAAGAQTRPAGISTEAQNLYVRKDSMSGLPSAYNQADEKVDRAKPADNEAAGKTSKLQASAAPATDALVSNAADWRITPAGALQRSLDQGNTWQNVSVSALVATNLDATAQPTFARAKGAAKAMKEGTTPVVFRALAANGTEVWAGGSAGLIYHSTDSGNHWTRVLPSSSGAVLTGDVIGLDFADAQHGKVSTSTSEIWITADDGITWQKQ